MYVHCMVYRGQTVAILIHLQSVGHPSIMVFNHLSSVPSDVYQDEDDILYCIVIEYMHIGDSRLSV